MAPVQVFVVCLSCKESIKCSPVESRLVSVVAKRQVVSRVIVLVRSGRYDDLQCHVRRFGVLDFCQRDACVFCNR